MPLDFAFVLALVLVWLLALARVFLAGLGPVSMVPRQSGAPQWHAKISSTSGGSPGSRLISMVMPALALGFALALGLPPLAASVSVLAASLPAGVNSYLIATRFGTGQGLAANSMTLGTLLAALSSVFWFAVAKAVFG